MLWHKLFNCLLRTYPTAPYIIIYIIDLILKAESQLRYDWKIDHTLNVNKQCQHFHPTFKLDLTMSNMASFVEQLISFSQQEISYRIRCLQGQCSLVQVYKLCLLMDAFFICHLSRITEAEKPLTRNIIMCINQCKYMWCYESVWLIWLPSNDTILTSFTDGLHSWQRSNWQGGTTISGHPRWTRSSKKAQNKW